MLTLGLEELFTPEQLKAFRERWAGSAEVSAAQARDIVRQLTNPTDREALTVQIVLCLVGDEPDFYAWMEALAVGSFELRPNVKYAQHGKAGMQPARFFQDQRKLIEGVADRNLTPEQKQEWRHAYEDALKLIVASQLLHEMRVGVAAKAALGVAWPLMLAADGKRFGLRRRKLLHLFGGEPEFIERLREAIETALQAWIEEHHGGHAPPVGHLSGDFDTLPGEPTDHEILAAVDPVAEAIGRYRVELFNRLDKSDYVLRKELPPMKPEEAAQLDAEAIRHARDVKSDVAELVVVAPAQTFSYFNDEQGNPIQRVQYSEESLARLQALLPLLRARGVDDLMGAAAARAYGRQIARARRQKHPSQDDVLANEIHDWVGRGLPPPPHMRFEDAHLFEEEACYQYLEHFDHWPGLEEWRSLGFFPDPAARRADPLEIYAENRVPPPPAAAPDGG